MKLLKTAVVSTLLVAGLSLPAQARYSAWENIKAPVAGKTQSVGAYANGCIIGAKPLALRGEGYQVIRSYKNRYYGHPKLLSFLTRLGKNAKAAGLPTMLVADMGMPAGGRFSSGHQSHQTGLDTDVWLRFGPLSDKEAQSPIAKVMVTGSDVTVNSNWTNKQATLIKLAASDAEVARIFVNPAIKVKLCQTAKGDRSWLRKVRPWFGHTAHMHVRLTCPADSPNCESQAPIPVGDGCGAELYSWFEPKTSSGSKKVKALPVPPSQCRMILSSKGLK